MLFKTQTKKNITLRLYTPSVSVQGHEENTKTLTDDREMMMECIRRN